MINIKKIGRNNWISITGMVILLLILNWLASAFHSRIDLTNEKRFTISPVTKELLKKLDAPVTIDVLLKGQYPSGFRNLASATEDLLREFREVAGPDFHYRLIAPDELVEGTFTSYADTLDKAGKFFINLTSQVEEGSQQQLIYPVAVIRYKDWMLPVSLFKEQTREISSATLNSAEAMLEYHLADGLAKLTDSMQPVVGYLTGNGEPAPGDYRVYDLFENILRPNYGLYTLNLNTQSQIPDAFKLAIMVKPTAPFTTAAKLKLDQYLMKGGRLLIFMDRLEAEMDSLQMKNQVVAYDRSLELNDLLFRYGARVNPNLIMDLQCDYLPFDVNGNGQFQLLPWNYFPLFSAPQEHPVTKGLGMISGRFVNSIDTIEVDGVKKTVLLRSSSNARAIGSPALISGAENVYAPQDEKFQTADIPAAVLLEGNFRSLFANRLNQELKDSLAKDNQTFIEASVKPGAVILVSDGDMVMNALTKGTDPIPMGMNPYTYGTQREYPFANRDFLLNCLSYLCDEKGLNELKSKDYSIRLLDVKKIKDEKLEWQLLNIAGPIFIVILFALIFAWIRKMRFTKKMKA